MYGKIITKYQNNPNDPRGLLVRVLASVVFQFDWIRRIACNDISHTFHNIPLFNYPDLVARLKEKSQLNLQEIFNR